eukprot:1998633-Rhodomonas_salina.1
MLRRIDPSCVAERFGERGVEMVERLHSVVKFPSQLQDQIRRDQEDHVCAAAGRLFAVVHHLASAREGGGTIASGLQNLGHGTAEMDDLADCDRTKVVTERSVHLVDVTPREPRTAQLGCRDTHHLSQSGKSDLRSVSSLPSSWLAAVKEKGCAASSAATHL